MFGFLIEVFIRLLACIVVNVSSHAKSVFLSNQKCNIWLTLINLHPIELHYYLFAVRLDRCVRSCNTLSAYLIKYLFQTKQDLN